MNYIQSGVEVRSGKTGMVLNLIDIKILELENLKQSILQNKLIESKPQKKFHKIKNIHDYIVILENREITQDEHFNNLKLVIHELYELNERLIIDLYNRDRVSILIQILNRLVDKYDNS